MKTVIFSLSLLSLGASGVDLDNKTIINAKLDSLSVQDGRIAITTDSGTLWGKDNPARNIVLASEPVENFTAELSLSIDPQHFGEQAGLILYQDDDNYIKLVRELLKEHVIVIAREMDGQAAIVFKTPFEPNGVTLRMNRNADGLVLSWKADGAKLFAAYPMEELGLTGPFRVGFFTHGTNPDNTAVFSEFSVTRD